MCVLVMSLLPVAWCEAVQGDDACSFNDTFLPANFNISIGKNIYQKCLDLITHSIMNQSMLYFMPTYILYLKPHTLHYPVQECV